MDFQDAVTQPLFNSQVETARGLRFDPTTWPYLVARSYGVATIDEIRQLLTRLDPWLATSTSLLALWIDASSVPSPWFDEAAASAVSRWLTRHGADLRGRRISIAFVSQYGWKRQYLEQRLCHTEALHGMSLDVFAHEHAARTWLRAHAVAAASATPTAKLRALRW